MPLARLENFLKNLSGNTIYVDPNELDSSDSIENRGNSRTRPFKTIQRALLEAARFSYVTGSNNDLFDQTTILISPGTHYIDNRPGYYYDGSQLLDVNNAVRGIVQFSVNSNFNLSDSDNELYLYNSADGGVIVPKGVSLVATDLRKTKIRPKFVPDPANGAIQRTSIFKLTGASYIYGFSIYDGDPTGGVYNTYSQNTVNPTYSHHKLTAFEYVDGKNKYQKDGVTYTKTDLETYYYKLSLAYGTYSNRPIEDGFNDLQPNPEENKIVGDLGQGSIEISEAISGDGSTATTTITVTTATEHQLTPLTPIQVTGLALNSVVGSQQYNGNFVVSQVISPTEFTYQLSSDPILATPQLTNAQVKILSDTVSSSSPYIFNCSLKSVYGMSGLHADGSKATGFKSIVTAQFTGISLQRDDRAFLKYDDVSGSYKTQEDLGQSVSLHQDSRALYNPDWESFHIKASNDAFIQCVSIFAIGYSKQFVADSGGDQSITNSNSNFGSISLLSRGFKESSLSKDNHGFVTHIIPPKDAPTEESQITCYSVNVGLTTSLRTTYSPNNTRIYLNGYNAQFEPPKPKIRGYTIGARSDDKIYVGTSSGIVTATISPNYQVSYNIDSIDVVNNTLTLEGSVSGLSTSQPVRVIANNAILPDGLEPQKIYYIHPESSIDSGVIKLSDTVTGSNIVDIKNDIGIDIEDNLKLVSRVSDSLPGNPGNPIQWDSTNDNWYLQISANSSFIGSLTGLETPSFYVNRIIDNRTSDDKSYRVRFVIPKESVNASEPSSGFIIQKSSSPLDSILSQPNSVDLNSSPESDKFKLVRNSSSIVDAWTTTSGSTITANIVTTYPHNLEVGNKVKIYNLKSTSEPNPVGLGTGTGFNGSFVVTDVVDDLQFRYNITVNPGTISTITSSSTASWLNQRDCNTQNRVPPYTILEQNRDDLPYFTCNQVNNDYQVYKIKTIQKYSENALDGVYHLYLNVFKNTPSDSNFNSSDYKLSQNLNNLYPDVDSDNTISDVDNAVSAASRQIIGKVDVSDTRLSTTKETVINYLGDFNDATKVSSITKVSSTCTVQTSRSHNLNGVRQVTITSAGGGFVTGNYYNIPICGGSGEGATANVVISAGGSASSVLIANPGSGYEIGDSLTLKGIPGSVNIVTVTAVSLLQDGQTAIQVLGSVYPENNGVFEIEVTGSDTFTYTNNSGRTEDPSTAVIIPIQSYPISATSYSSGESTITVSNVYPHPFLVGNTVYFDNVSGKFTITSVQSPTSFTVIGDATGASHVYGSGLTSQPNITDSTNENVSTRQFSIVDGFKARIDSGSTVSKTATTLTVSSPIGLKKGEFIQINDEILLITRISGSQVTVIRGCLGTSASAHVDNSAVRRVKVNAVELRRNSILRASGHTFEYTGYGPGNYSTSMPTNQDRILSNDEVLISQSLPTHGGLVVYTGMNSNGEFFIGRKKYDAATGEELNVNEDIGDTGTFFDELTVNRLIINDTLDASTATVDLGVVQAKDVTATSFTGPLTGNVTGNVTGNLSGEVNATAFDTNPSGVVVTGIATATSFVGNGIIPLGGIIIWSGSTASIPTGWALCNGSNGTPDLRDRFIVGAGSNYSVGNTGGSANATLVAHSHPINYSNTVPGATFKHLFSSIGRVLRFPPLDAIDGIMEGAEFSGTGTESVSRTNISIGAQGSSATNANLPPYYALAYIMRTS